MNYVLTVKINKETHLIELSLLKKEIRFGISTHQVSTLEKRLIFYQLIKKDEKIGISLNLNDNNHEQNR